jgi:hypothetical protein
MEIFPLLVDWKLFGTLFLSAQHIQQKLPAIEANKYTLFLFYIVVKLKAI